MRGLAGALIVVAIVCLLVFFAVHGAFNSCTSRGLEQAGSVSSRWSWIPPGVECTYERDDGRVRTDLIPWIRR